MHISPVIIGRGMAGQAMARSLAILATTDIGVEIAPARFAERGSTLATYSGGAPCPVLFIASPHALHSETILEGQASGYRAIVVEKPSCVSEEQAQSLAKVSIPVSVCHGYRMMWGPQTIRKMITSGELGAILSIEGRYWQSSAGQRALDPSPPPVQLWKNNPGLSGPFDALLDLGTHWTDLAFFLFGEQPCGARMWISHLNSEAAHRDTHVHLDFMFSGNRPARASISKTVHGAGNDLELTVVGERKSLTWRLGAPDVLECGEGATRIVLQRKETAYGSGQRPFHAMGWVEGYIEIIKQTLLGLAGKQTLAPPSLPENIAVIRTLLRAAQSAT